MAFNHTTAGKLQCAMLFAIAFGLTACSSEKVADLTTCGTEADRFFQGYRADDVNNPRSQYIIECMAAKGYEFDISSTSCDSRHSLPTQSACYVSAGWLARIINQF